MAAACCRSPCRSRCRLLLLLRRRRWPGHVGSLRVAALVAGRAPPRDRAHERLALFCPSAPAAPPPHRLPAHVTHHHTYSLLLTQANSIVACLRMLSQSASRRAWAGPRRAQASASLTAWPAALDRSPPGRRWAGERARGGEQRNALP
eukprot:scaffold1344_cov388-Prasinococcus_capsulatus_cf.AAC.5